MAGSILSNFAENLLTKLRSHAIHELGLLLGVNDELEKLKENVYVIAAVLLDIEEKHFQSNAVKDWLSKLQQVFYIIDDLTEEFEYEAVRRQVMTRRKTKLVCVFLSKFSHISFRLKVGQKIKEIKEMLEVIDREKINEFCLSKRVLNKSTVDVSKNRHDRTSFTVKGEVREVIGRDDDKKAIINLLLKSNTNEDIAVVAIFGMGGIGKTTIALSIYNDIMFTEHFELKIWVFVGEEFDVTVVIKSIIVQATREELEFSQMGFLLGELERIIHGKKYLLVMDDVWNMDYEKWITLKRCLMNGVTGNKILITTRNERVANTFGTLSYHLESLNEKNAWLLFEKIALGSEGAGKDPENSSLVEISKDIMKKLHGLPLAIKVVGQYLHGKKSTDYSSWLKSMELYQTMDQKDDVNPVKAALELSYNWLSSNLKQCFTYCALFPKDHEIRKDEVIMQWVAQGFIQPNGKDKLIDIGKDYFMELLSISLFQGSRKDKWENIITFKMHDMIHDLACSIVKDEVLNDVNARALNERTNHVSFGLISWEELKELPNTLHRARNLRTCFLQYNQFLFQRDSNLNKIFESVVCNLLSLRALELQLSIDNHNAKFLRCISKLKYLRYLKIEMSKDARVFPNSFTGLYNLEVLILRCIGLEELPRDMKNWRKLNHLYLYGSKKIEVLPNSIAELKYLETLVIRNYIKLKGFSGDIRNLTNLTQLDLQGNVNIELLPNSIAHLHNLETLILRDCDKLKELPRDIRSLINLKHLDLHGCRTLTHMPRRLGELTNLQTLNLFVLGKDNGGRLSELNKLNKLKGSLTIKGLQFHTAADLQMDSMLLQLKLGLQKLVLEWSWPDSDSINEPRVDALDDAYQRERFLECLQSHPYLREICIKGYNEVKLCTWLSASSYSFSCLVRMKLLSCKRLEHLPQFDQFPKLKHLRLEDLPSIEHIACNNDYPSPSTLFPSLEELIISRMPSLKRWWEDKGQASTKFPCLSRIHIFYCPLLASVTCPTDPDGLDGVSWQSFEKLSSLRLSYIYEWEFLWDCVQYVTTLQELSIDYFPNLTSLPESIGNLASLSKLEIINCQDLTSLPEWIRSLTSLTKMKIWSCPKLDLNRPILEEECKKETGEDWLKIAHIPDVDIRSNFL